MGCDQSRIRSRRLIGNDTPLSVPSYADTLHGWAPNRRHVSTNMLLLQQKWVDYFFNVRIYETRPLTSSGFNLSPYFGIFGGLPFVITALRSASDCFCTSALQRSCPAAFFPSAPWHMAHFDL